MANYRQLPDGSVVNETTGVVEAPYVNPEHYVVTPPRSRRGVNGDESQDTGKRANQAATILLIGIGIGAYALIRKVRRRRAFAR